MNSADVDTKICPYCAKTIKVAAIVCRYCGRDLGQQVASPVNYSPPGPVTPAAVYSPPNPATPVVAQKTKGDSALGAVLIIGLILVSAWWVLSLVFGGGSGGVKGPPTPSTAAIKSILTLVSLLLAVGGVFALFVVAVRRSPKLAIICLIFPICFLALLDSDDGRKAWGILSLGLLLASVGTLQ